MKMITIYRLFFILLCFLFVSKAAFSQVQKDTSKTVVLLNDSIDGSKFIIDSLNNLTTTIKNSLDSFPRLNQDSLLIFKHQLKNAQEKAVNTEKQLKDNKNAEADSLGLINDLNAIYFKIARLKSRVDDRIRKLENLTIKKKAGYIWTAPILVKPNDLWTTLKSEIKNPLRTFIELKDSEWGGLFLLLLLSIGYFYWIFKNEQVSSPNNVKNNLPIAQSILFFLILAPLFDRQTSYFYIELILLLILLISFF